MCSGAESPSEKVQLNSLHSVALEKILNSSEEFLLETLKYLILLSHVSERERENEQRNNKRGEYETKQNKKTSTTVPGT